MKKPIFILIAAMVWISCQKHDFKSENSQVKEESYKTAPIKLWKADLPLNIGKYKEGELLVKLKDNSNKRVISKLRVKGLVRTKAMERFNDNGFYKVDVVDVIAEQARLKASPDVEWVSPNWTETISEFTPNDPYMVSGELWGMNNIHAPDAWNSGNFGKSDVFVGVIDEGCQYYHCDLNNNTWVNEAEMNGIPGVDDDNNGYIDDDRGWNWFDNNNLLYLPGDDHGTHVTGTICGKGNNGIGVIGVAPNVKVINLKFLSNYGFDDNAIRAIDYAIDLKFRKGMNIKVLSNSWGGGGFNQGLIDAIERAKQADILFVVAAGNSNNNNDTNPAYGYPSAYPNENIIAVGASDWSNAKASFSSYGKTSVDIFAPGTAIWSTLPSSTHTSTYGQYGGTSMATPHVSGAIALLASVRPTLGWAELKSTIMETVTPVSVLANYCVTGGVVNVSSFIGTTPAIVPDASCGTPPPMDMTPPPTPQNLHVTETTIGDPTYGNSVRLEWDTAGFYNPLTKQYNIWMKQGSGSFTWIGSISGYWAVRINGLSLDTYQFYIVAQSGWGALSQPSNTVTADLTDPFNDTEDPSIPQNLTAFDIGEQSFGLTWTASTDNHTTPYYRVNWRKLGRTTWTMATSNSTSYIVRDFLETGATYECMVEAIDAAGNVSDPSSIIQVTTGTSEPPPPPPPPPPSYTITATLSGNSPQVSPVELTFSVTTDGTIASQSMERKQGGGSYSTISNNPASPFIDNSIPRGNPNFTYRLKVVLTNGQVGYSNDKVIQVKKK